MSQNSDHASLPSTSNEVVDVDVDIAIDDTRSATSPTDSSPLKTDSVVSNEEIIKGTSSSPVTSLVGSDRMNDDGAVGPPPLPEEKKSTHEQEASEKDLEHDHCRDYNSANVAISLHMPSDNDAIVNEEILGTLDLVDSTAGLKQIGDNGTRPCLSAQHSLRSGKHFIQTDDDVINPLHTSLLGSSLEHGDSMDGSEQMEVVQMDDGINPLHHTALRSSFGAGPTAVSGEIEDNGGSRDSLGGVAPYLPAGLVTTAPSVDNASLNHSSRSGTNLFQIDDDVEPLHHSAVEFAFGPDDTNIAISQDSSEHCQTKDEFRRSGNMVQVDDDVEPLHHSLLQDTFEYDGIAGQNSSEHPVKSYLSGQSSRNAVQLDDDPDSEPLHHSAFDSSDPGEKNAAIDAKLASIEEGPPVPLNFADFELDQGEDSELVLQNKASRGNQRRRLSQRIRIRPFQSRLERTEPPANEDAGEETPLVNVDLEQPSTAPDASMVTADTNARPNLDGDLESMPIIPEAFLVEENDEEVYEATPLELPLPLWKQAKARLLLCGFCTLLIALSIALAVALSLANKPNREVAPQDILYLPMPPSYSASPSTEITNGPSSSQGPSFSPTECRERMIETAQEIDPLIENLSNPRVAVDGAIMMIVAADSGSSKVHVIFYEKLETGVWKMTNFLTEDFLSENQTIAISGNTALVGLSDAFKGAGVLFMYEKGGSEAWKKIETPSISNNNSTGWGQSLDLDGDLACVGGLDSISIFHRRIDFHLGKWTWLYNINVAPPSECSISGNTIAIQNHGDGLRLYKYDQDLFGVLPHQDSVSASATLAALGQNFLVFFNETSLNIFRQGGTNQSFAFSQQLNYSDHGGSHISIDKDILVIGGRNETLIFSKHDGYWRESIALDQSYDGYEVSGRSVIATMNNRVYSFDLADCTQTMPTQTPTSSMTPTSAHCYGIHIAVVFDKNATSWDLRRIDEVGDTIVLESHASAADDILPTYVCLPEGEYNFTIYTDSGDEEGHYYVTSSNGGLIVRGGDFGFNDTTTFIIPFSPAPSMMPSLRLSASPSSFPSRMPSISYAPSISHMETLFGTDTENESNPEVALYGDAAVVTRDFIDIQFFSYTKSSFQAVMKIDIDYEVSAVAMSDNTAVVGSEDNSSTGTVYIYGKDQNGIWNETMRIVPSGIGDASFGCSVAINGDVMIVGARSDGDAGQGSAYIYRRNETSWIREANLNPPDNLTASTFGGSVSVKGDKVVVADHHYGTDFWTGLRGRGRVFVYEYDSFSSSWAQLGDSLINTNDECRNFGSFVRLTHDEELLVSCGDLLSQDHVVYYYEKQEMGDGYVLQQSITDFDKDVVSMSVNGNTMVVSERTYGFRSFVVRFFVRKNQIWGEVNHIDELLLEESFGRRVVLFGNTTFIASPTNVYVLQDYFNLSPTLVPTLSPLTMSKGPPLHHEHCRNIPFKDPRNNNATFHERVEDCCKKWLSSQLDECISASSPSNETHKDAYVSRRRRSGRRRRGLREEKVMEVESEEP